MSRSIVMPGEASCRVCGCSDLAPCVLDGNNVVIDIEADQTLPNGCHVCFWVEADLCSGCVEAPAPAPLLFDALGFPLRGSP